MAKRKAGDMEQEAEQSTVPSTCISKALYRLLRGINIPIDRIKKVASTYERVAILAGADVSEAHDGVSEEIVAAAVRTLHREWQSDKFKEEDADMMRLCDLWDSTSSHSLQEQDDFLRDSLQAAGSEMPVFKSKEEERAEKQNALVGQCIGFLREAGSRSSHSKLINFHLSQQEGSERQAFSFKLLENVFRAPAVGSLAQYVHLWSAWCDWASKSGLDPYNPDELEVAFFVSSGGGPTGPSGRWRSGLKMARLLGISDEPWTSRYTELAAEIPLKERTSPTTSAPCPTPDDVDMVVTEFMRLTQLPGEQNAAHAVYLGGWLFSSMATLRFDDAAAISVSSMAMVEGDGDPFIVSVIRGGKTARGSLTLAAGVAVYNGVNWGSAYLDLLRKWVPDSKTLFPRCYSKRTGNWAITESYETYQGVNEAMRPLLSAICGKDFSGHSPRHFLPTLAAARAVSKGDRDKLGRWKDKSGSDRYDSLIAATQVRVQREVLDAIAGGWRPPVIPSIQELVN